MLRSCFAWSSIRNLRRTPQEVPPERSGGCGMARMNQGRPVLLMASIFLIAAVGGVGATIFGRQSVPEHNVDFNRDIRPIFNANCMGCHGGVKQASNVSFSYREQVLGKGKSGRPTVVPGSPQASELMTRVTAKDPDVRMPLNAAPLGFPASPEELAINADGSPIRMAPPPLRRCHTRAAAVHPVPLCLPPCRTSSQPRA